MHPQTRMEPRDSSAARTAPTPPRRASGRRSIASAAPQAWSSNAPGGPGEASDVPRFTPHGLRHTYAALHLQHGTDVYYIGRQLGHTDIALTVGTYGAWLQPHGPPWTRSTGRPPRRRREPDLQAKCKRPATKLATGRTTT